MTKEEVLKTYFGYDGFRGGQASRYGRTFLTEIAAFEE